MYGKIIKQICLIVSALIFISISVTQAQMVKAVVAVTGSMKDAVSKKPLAVNVTVFDNTGKKVNTAKSNDYEDGYYFVTGLLPGNVYTFEISSTSHFKENITISIPNTDKYLEISRDFNLKPLMLNAKIPLAVSPFEYNKTKLRFGSVLALEGLANTLKNNPKVKFTIISYPDNDKNPEANKDLTLKRADALMDYLVVNGIDPMRIKIQESSNTDPDLPPPVEKRAKGKKYIGSTYIIINEI